MTRLMLQIAVDDLSEVTDSFFGISQTWKKSLQKFRYDFCRIIKISKL